MINLKLVNIGGVLQEFAQTPNVILDAVGDGGQRFDSRVNSTEIEIRDVQSESVLVIVTGFGVGKRQASELLVLGTNSEISTFDSASRNTSHVRVSPIRPTLRAHYLRSLVAVYFCLCAAILLNADAVAGVATESSRDAGLIASPSVSVDLAVVTDGRRELVAERLYIFEGSAANVVGQNQFCVPLHPDVGVRITDFASVASQLARMFSAENRRPEFVALAAIDQHVFDLGFQESGASFTNFDQQGNDRLFVGAADALNRTNAVAFKQEEKDQLGTIQRDSHAADETFAGLGEYLFAVPTTEPLIASPVFTKAPAFVVGAFDTDHYRAFTVLCLDRKAQAGIQSPVKAESLCLPAKIRFRSVWAATQALQ